jgi:hypothetical protein
MLLSLDTKKVQTIDHYGKTVDFQKLQTTFYKRSKYKCSSTVLHFGLDKKLVNRVAAIQLKNHGEWTFVPIKISNIPKKSSKRSVSTYQKKNIKKPRKNKKLTKLEQKLQIINDDRNKFLKEINDPNYNPFSPLMENDERDDKEDTEYEETTRKTLRKTQNTNNNDKQDDKADIEYETNIEQDNKEATAYKEKMTKDQSKIEFEAFMSGNFIANAENTSNTNISTRNITGEDIESNTQGCSDAPSSKNPKVDTINEVEKTNSASSMATNTIPTSHDEHFNKVSGRYAPRNLTCEDNQRQIDFSQFKKNMDNKFSIVVRIGQPKNEQLEFHEGRILLSLLTSMQKVMPYTKIVPIKQAGNEASDITSKEDIKIDEKFYEKYFEKPNITKQAHYVTRLHFVSKKPFFWFKKNLQFQKWLQNEKIRLEENNISEIHCPKVGFLTRCHPRSSLIKVYEVRIKKLFQGKSVPEFYCTIENVSVRQATTKVIAIRAAESDVNKLLSLFKTFKNDHFHPFIPWKEWIAMVNTKQLDVIRKQNIILVNIKSIIVSGFKNSEHIKFNHSNSEVEFMQTGIPDGTEEIDFSVEYGNMTTTEFLKLKYKDGQGNQIFHHCYPVTLGIREFMVLQRHAQEAIDLCKVIKEDLLQYMSDDAADAIFDDIDDIKSRAVEHEPWAPFVTANEYEHVDLNAEKEDALLNSKKAKRNANNISTNNHQMTYRDATKKSNVNNNKTLTTKNSQPSSQGQDNNEKENQILCDIQKKLSELETKQKEHEDKFEKSTADIITKMQNTEHKFAQSTTEIITKMEKTDKKLDIIETKTEKMLTADFMFEYFGDFLNAQHKSKKNKKHKSRSTDSLIDDDTYSDEDGMLLDNIHHTNNKIGKTRQNFAYSLDEENDKENYTTGGDQIKRATNKTDYFGNCGP